MTRFFLRNTCALLALLFHTAIAAQTGSIPPGELRLENIEKVQVEVLEKFTRYTTSRERAERIGANLLRPSADSRIIYVSASEGDDTSGRVYRAGEIRNLTIPENVAAFRSIAAAAKLMRKGYPDYLMLRRGDSWTLEKPVVVKGGRSESERMVLMAYGKNDRRPILNSTQTALKIFGTSSNIAIAGLHLYARDRDPDSTYFSGWGSGGKSVGIRAYAGKGSRAGHLLVENNIIDFFRTGIVIQSEGAAYRDIVVINNLVSNSYSENSHSQGFFSSNSSVLLDSNLFYHNGWYQQSSSNGRSQKGGQATIFNHNTYIVNAVDSLLRDNMFIDPASAHNKWASNSKQSHDTINAENIVVRNNFYYGGEIGISAGGNKDLDTGPRWRNMVIADNVLLGIGKNRPTNRHLGWYLTIDDWESGYVCGNLLLPNLNSRVSNLLGISITGHSSNIMVAQNHIVGLLSKSSKAAAITLKKGPIRNILLSGNRILLPEGRMQVISLGNEASEIASVRNSYFSAAPAGKWFRFRGRNLSNEEWKNAVSDDNSGVPETLDNADIGDLSEYLASIGISSMPQFVREAANFLDNGWPERFQANYLNDHFRQKIDAKTCSTDL